MASMTNKTPKKRKRFFRVSIGLKVKIILTVLFLALGIVSVMITRFAITILTIDEEIQSVYAIGATSLGVIGTVNSERACDEVRDVYKSIPDERKNNPADPVYLANFPDFDIREDDIDEKLIDSVISTIEGKNRGITAVGLCILDDENKRIVVVRSTNKDTPSGFWTDFDYIRMQITTEEYLLYTQEKDKDSREYNIRVLIPIQDDDEGEYDGYMCIDQKNTKIYFWTIGFLFIYIIVYAIAIAVIWGIISFNFKHSVVRPIKKLSKAANSWADSPDKLADTYFFDKLNIKSNDELGDLCDAMKSMETELHNYMEHLENVTREKQRVSTELEIAARLQANMLPDKLEITGQPFSISTLMKPARSVGGDFYDFFMIGEDRVAMVIADVSDKGVPASLFMVVSKTLVGNRLKDNPDDIAAALARANKQLYENNKELMFVTVFAGIYSLKDGTLSYVNAGHEDPVIYRKAENKYSFIFEEHDLFMGVDPDIDFTERKIKLDKGDKLFLYTDGITEAMDTADNLYGVEGLLDELNKDTSLGGEEVIDALWNEISKFQSGKNQSDDVTMLLFEV